MLKMVNLELGIVREQMEKKTGLHCPVMQLDLESCIILNCPSALSGHCRSGTEQPK